MKRLAVIISYHTTPVELEDSLLSILENRPEACEILVVRNKPYENPYDLKEEEVRFLPEGDSADGMLPDAALDACRPIAECVRMGLNVCDSEYVYLMPAGVQFQLGWLASLEILDLHADLGAFFLDENLELGGFFRKKLLESFFLSADSLTREGGAADEPLAPIHSEDHLSLSGKTDAECLATLVEFIQERGVTCGLAEFEEVEETEKSAGNEVTAEAAGTAEVVECGTFSEELAVASGTKLQEISAFNSEDAFPSEGADLGKAAILRNGNVQEGPSVPLAACEKVPSIAVPDSHEIAGESGILGRLCTFCRKIFSRAQHL